MRRDLKLFKEDNQGNIFLNSIRIGREKDFPQFFRHNFLDNELKYGRKLTRDSKAFCGYTNFTRTNNERRLNFNATSFFFNSKFKFGFVFKQKISNSFSFIRIRNGKKFKIGVNAKASSFLEEQKNNHFIHYICRENGYYFDGPSAYSEWGAQFIEPHYSFSAEDYENESAAFFSSNAIAIKNFYYKTKLSARNCRFGVYKQVHKIRRKILRSPFFCNKFAFSVFLKRYRKWAVRKQDGIRKLLYDKEFLAHKKRRKIRAFFTAVSRHWTFFYKLRGRLRFNRIRALNLKLIPPFFFKSKFSQLARGLFYRKKKATGTNIYNRAKAYRSDNYAVYRMLKMSLAVSKNRFRKKRHRRPILRNYRKCVARDVL